MQGLRSVLLNKQKNGSTYTHSDQVAHILMEMNVVTWFSVTLNRVSVVGGYQVQALRGAVTRAATGICAETRRSPAKGPTT